MEKHLVIKYFDTYPIEHFYFNSKDEAIDFKRKGNLKLQKKNLYLTEYIYRGITTIEEEGI